MPKSSKKFGFSTTAIHAGGEPDELTGAVSPAIFLTSTYVQDELGKPRRGYEYARVTNPTRDRVQENLAALEGGVAARVFASGMASITAVCMTMKKGDHLLCGDNVYGGTPRLFNQVMANLGLEFSYVDTSNLDATRKAMRKNTKYVWLETPTNPLMTVSDIAAVAEIAHRGGAELVVDNT
ncbi:MAG TPA: PLP-dependent transferase, partial [Terriglobales bacterium]|nr:PLP-dependent transferase [Terriglobales bacterium]